MGKNKSRKTDMGLSKRKESNMKLFETLFAWLLYTLLLPVFLVAAVLREIWEWLAFPWVRRE